MKPTLGYPSVITAIYALRREGKTLKQIGEKLGIKENTVSSMLTRAKKRGYGLKGQGKPLRIAGQYFNDLSDEAIRRDTTPQLLAAQILRAVAEDDLFDAVLGEL